MIDALEQAEAAVVACFDTPAWAASEHDLVAALEATHRLEQRMAAVKLTLTRELDGRGTATAQGASSTAVWLRDRLQLGVGHWPPLAGIRSTLGWPAATMRSHGGPRVEASSRDVGGRRSGAVPVRPGRDVGGGPDVGASAACPADRR
ncbi:hypothetical protein ACQPYV_10690 [Micromonospora saelicesensis]|uniref:hypothetical protein n=1 Tax=Micromonospora saelicesensis TaxID=285676 RepID=UPI0021ABEAAE|nr:hypothetical protein [Micromonospora saelicesensis]